MPVVSALALDDRACPTSQQGLQRVGRIGFGQPRPVGKGRPGSLTSAPYPVTKMKGIFSASSRSAIAKLFSRIRRHRAARNPGRGRQSCRAPWPHFPRSAPPSPRRPRIVSSKSSAMIGSSSTISTSSGMRVGREGGFHDLAGTDVTELIEGRVEPGTGPAAEAAKAPRPVPGLKPSHRGFPCLCTCEHITSGS